MPKALFRAALREVLEPAELSAALSGVPGFRMIGCEYGFHFHSLHPSNLTCQCADLIRSSLHDEGNETDLSVMQGNTLPSDDNVAVIGKEFVQSGNLRSVRH